MSIKNFAFTVWGLVAVGFVAIGIHQEADLWVQIALSLPLAWWMSFVGTRVLQTKEKTKQ